MVSSKVLLMLHHGHYARASKGQEDHQTMKQELKTLECAQGNMTLEWDSGVLLSHPKPSVMTSGLPVSVAGPHIAWQLTAFALVC